MTTTDSISAQPVSMPIDSLPAAPDSVAVIETQPIKECGMLIHNHEVDAPTTSSEPTAYHVGIVDFAHGIKPDSRPDHPGIDSGVVLILLGMFLIVTFTFKHFMAIYRSLIQDLFVVRQRENAFDEHTAGEASTIFALNVQTAICQAVLLFAALNMSSPVAPGRAFPLLASLTGVTVTFYYAQAAIYRLLAYSFADPFLGSQWVRGLSATQSLMGFLLFVPALAVLFYPATTPTMLTIAAVIYLFMRISFIIKGFRIFYENFLSLIYFILYLCALEIVPLLFLAASTIKLSTFL